MFVNEIFNSLQGEGLTQGAPTIFIRFAGCNLACSWCDTKYAQGHTDSTEMNVSAIVDRVRRLTPSRRHVVCITGGEPLIQNHIDLEDLILSLHRDCRIQKFVIETSGSQTINWLLVWSMRPFIDLCLDYKLESSGSSRSMILSNYTQLQPRDVIKFVCSDLNDAKEAVAFLEALSKEHATKPTIFFHEVGGVASRWLAEFVLSIPSGILDRFDVRLGIQLHKLLWGIERAR